MIKSWISLQRLLLTVMMWARSIDAYTSNSYSMPDRWIGAMPTLRGDVLPSAFVSKMYSVFVRIDANTCSGALMIASIIRLCIGVMFFHALKLDLSPDLSLRSSAPPSPVHAWERESITRHA